MPQIFQCGFARPAKPAGESLKLMIDRVVAQATGRSDDFVPNRLSGGGRRCRTEATAALEFGTEIGQRVPYKGALRGPRPASRRVNSSPSRRLPAGNKICRRLGGIGKRLSRLPLVKKPSCG